MSADSERLCVQFDRHPIQFDRSLDRRSADRYHSALVRGAQHNDVGGHVRPEQIVGQISGVVVDVFFGDCGAVDSRLQR